MEYGADFRIEFGVKTATHTYIGTFFRSVHLNNILWSTNLLKYKISWSHRIRRSPMIPENIFFSFFSDWIIAIDYWNSRIITSFSRTCSICFSILDKQFIKGVTYVACNFWLKFNNIQLLQELSELELPILAWNEPIVMSFY